MFVSTACAVSVFKISNCAVILLLDESHFICVVTFKHFSLSSSNQTHVHSVAVTGMDDDGHLAQVVRSSSAAVAVDLLQQDSGDQVSGEAQVACTDSREGD